MGAVGAIQFFGLAIGVDHKMLVTQPMNAFLVDKGIHHNFSVFSQSVDQSLGNPVVRLGFDGFYRVCRLKFSQAFAHVFERGCACFVLQHQRIEFVGKEDRGVGSYLKRRLSPCTNLPQ